MKPIIKSRNEYNSKLLELDKEKKCGFCNIKEEFLLKEYNNWIWVYSEFPYWKYNTIIVSKKHKTKFTELTDDELVELKTIFIEAEKAYLDSGVMKKDSNWGMDILWRQRVAMVGYETRSHAHIHLCPHTEGLFVDILDPEAHLVDVDLLKNTLV